MRKQIQLIGLLIPFLLISCRNDNADENKQTGLSEEYYSGGRNGTVFNQTTQKQNQIRRINDGN